MLVFYYIDVQTKLLKVRNNKNSHQKGNNVGQISQILKMAKREKPLENKVFFNRETDFGFYWSASDDTKLVSIVMCTLYVHTYIIKVSYNLRFFTNHSVIS